MLEYPIMIIPQYDLDKIKFATGSPTFERAVEIYNSGGVINFEEVGFGFNTRVRGSKGNFYNVYVSSRHYDSGNCNCYLGQNDTLCKHLVATAIYAIKRGERLTEEEKELIISPKCSGRLGELGKSELMEVKAGITAALRFLKSYTGPSRIWFQYQNSLCEGCNRLTAIVSKLPVSEQTAKLLVDLLLRVENKLSYGIDDSDGTIGVFIEEVVMVLKKYAELDLNCIAIFKKLCGLSTSFGWEEPLVEIFNKNLAANTHNK